MAVMSFPLIVNTIVYSTTRKISHIIPNKPLHRNLNKSAANNIVFGNFLPLISSQPVVQIRHREFLVAPTFNASKDSPEGIPPEAAGGDDEKDPRALEAVLKLYSAIKNQSVGELSEIIADECQVDGNLPSILSPLRGKKQVLDFFSYLIRTLGSDIQFVVKPTLQDGMTVGMHWSLEWNKTHVLGKGFSIHLCQVYNGKVTIRNMELFMEPMLHIEPLKLKIIGIMPAVNDKMNAIFKGRSSKVVWSFLFLCITATYLIVAKLIFR